MCFFVIGSMFCQDFLIIVWIVVFVFFVGVIVYIIVDVMDVVLVFFVEFVVGYFVEGGLLEDKIFFEVQIDVFEEEGVLQVVKVMEFGVVVEGVVEVGYVYGEVLGEVVDVVGGDFGVFDG